MRSWVKVAIVGSVLLSAIAIVSVYLKAEFPMSTRSPNSTKPRDSAGSKQGKGPDATTPEIYVFHGSLASIAAKVHPVNNPYHNKVSLKRNSAKTAAKCPTDLEISEKSRIFKSRINDNCRKYGYFKRVDWARFGNGTNNGYQQRDHLNPPEIWWSNFVVSEHLKATYTINEKAGSSQIRTALSWIATNKLIRNAGDLIFQENEVSFYNGTLYMLGNVGSLEKAKYIMDNYFHFAFFRDPLQRLYSGFLSKARSFSSDPHVTFLEPFKSSLRQKHLTPSFKLFLQFLDSFNDSSQFDQHFRPQVPLINSYGFIGETNDIGCSLPYLIKRLNPSLSVDPGKPGNTTREWKEIIGDDAELVRRVLRKHYQTDYDLLGYELPPFFSK